MLVNLVAAVLPNCISLSCMPFMPPWPVVASVLLRPCIFWLLLPEELLFDPDDEELPMLVLLCVPLEGVEFVFA